MRTPQLTPRSLPPWLGRVPAGLAWSSPKVKDRRRTYVCLATIGQAHTCTDSGLAMQNILLGAVEKGLGAASSGSVQRKKLNEILNIARTLRNPVRPCSGRTRGSVVIEEIGPGGDGNTGETRRPVHQVAEARLGDVILAE